MIKYLIRYKEDGIIKNINAVDTSLYQALSLTMQQWLNISEKIIEITELGEDISNIRYSNKVD